MRIWVWCPGSHEKLRMRTHRLAEKELDLGNPKPLWFVKSADLHRWKKDHFKVQFTIHTAIFRSEIQVSSPAPSFSVQWWSTPMPRRARPSSEHPDPISTGGSAWWMAHGQERWPHTWMGYTRWLIKLTSHVLRCDLVQLQWSDN